MAHGRGSHRLNRARQVTPSGKAALRGLAGPAPSMAEEVAGFVRGLARARGRGRRLPYWKRHPHESNPVDGAGDSPPPVGLCQRRVGRGGGAGRQQCRRHSWQTPPRGCHLAAMGLADLCHLLIGRCCGRDNRPQGPDRSSRRTGRCPVTSSCGAGNGRPIDSTVADSTVGRTGDREAAGAGQEPARFGRTTLIMAIATDSDTYLDTRWERGRSRRRIGQRHPSLTSISYHAQFQPCEPRQGVPRCMNGVSR